ncbi:Uncharacterised protein [Yersinia kristensenii]|nr:Uncharacterised protein [Yersinia kristensenii]
MNNVHKLTTCLFSVEMSNKNPLLVSLQQGVFTGSYF